MVKRILIANRGEIVVRVAAGCAKVGLEPCGIYSDADADSMHINHCKKVVRIGGNLPSESYLQREKVLDAAVEMGCDLVHPGYGFLAEDYLFAEMCEKKGLVFVGPSSSVLKLSGDKAKAKQVASSVAPVLKGGEVGTEDEALQLASSIGFPVIVKAVKGGGGRGLRVAWSGEELCRAFASSTQEALMSFGSGRLYIEKYLENPRHIEVQILGDSSGMVNLGERECSVQRRHQKLIEETPSPALSDHLRRKITRTAVEIAKQFNYTNAGTVEFLYEQENFYFMELNSRIQVEHPITEEVTGVDIVEQQLRIARGEGLTIRQDDIHPMGHAIECRINAEHPLTFAPFPGRVTRFLPPVNRAADTRIRVDTALYPGYSIPPFYDSLMAKLICFAKDRTRAIEKMVNSLESFRVSGVPTTIPFHLSALRDKRFVSGKYDTSFVNSLKYTSPKDEQMAAAVISLLPKKFRFRKNKDVRDAWGSSRFDKLVQNPDGLANHRVARSWRD